MGDLENFEYPYVEELEGISRNYFSVPASIILSNEMSNERLGVFSYFSMYKGLDWSLTFSVSDILRWMKKNSNRNATGINSRILQSINYLKEHGYLRSCNDLTIYSKMKVEYNLSKVLHDCKDDRFALLYADEVKKIMECDVSYTKDKSGRSIDNNIVLLVFAYLRMTIYRRKNKFANDYINVDYENNHEYDVNSQRLKYPEAFDCFYFEIDEELGLTPRSTSKAVRVLNDLGLIYSEALPKVKCYMDDGIRWRTDHTLFSNTYKREGSYLLESGSEYYLREIENKKKKIALFTQGQERGDIYG